jgi:putative phosphoribosyl transferase
MFRNREEAGIKLASKINKEKIKNAIVVAIPRGGVVLGKAVSSILRLPLAVLIVKKIGSPNNPELAIGATGPPTGGDNIVYWDEDIIKSLGISDKEKNRLLKKTIQSIRQKEKSLGLLKLNVYDKVAIIVDDGVATGATAVAASLILRKLGASKVILATPVIAKHTEKQISPHFYKIITIMSPRDFQAVGQFYLDFPQVEDEEVRKLLS